MDSLACSQPSLSVVLVFSGLHHLCEGLGNAYESMPVSLKMPYSEHAEKKKSPAQRSKGAEEKEPEGGSCMVSESLLNSLSPKLDDRFGVSLLVAKAKREI